MPVLNFDAILNHKLRVLRRVEGATDVYGHHAITFSPVNGVGLPCWLWTVADDVRRASFMRTQSGQNKLGNYKFLCGGTAILKEGDHVEPLIGIVGFTRAEVVKVKTIHDLVGGSHHIEAEVLSF